MVAVLAAVAAQAQTLLRDPDIEYALGRLSAPLIAAAGLSPARIKVLVIHDDSPNAFVVDDRHVFVNSGMILRLDRADALQAVIAHEIAHIANGHITRRMANRKSASVLSGVSVALAAAAGAASGESRAAAAVALGGTSTAQRYFLAHTRSEEASADISGLRYMVEGGADPAGMVEVLEMFRGQEALSTRRQDPYVRGHPLTRDRLRAVEGFAAAHKPRGDNAEARYWFLRAQGKLGAFLRKPSWTLRQVSRSDNSDIAIMRRAVAYHRQSDAKKAIAEIDALAAKRPRDPFVHELRGQILLESRQFEAATRAYGRAVQLVPDNALVLAGYGRALLATGAAGEALKVLEKARSRDPRDARLMRDLAQAYATAGNTGMASLATAERYALKGQLGDAGIHAERAANLLPRGSPGWQRAQDVLRAAQSAPKGRNRG